MKTYHLLILIFLSVLFGSRVYSQSFVYQGDELTLIVDDYKRGTVRWQESTDSLNWQDIPYATTNPYVFVPIQTAFYRAKVDEGSCESLYSESVKVELKCFVCGDSLIDYRDGQKYPTVLLGAQCWMARNLNIGKMVLLGNNQKDNGVIEKYSYYNDTTYSDIYGGLYQWNEMMQYVSTESTQGICPCNWHVPSELEWQELELALGMSAIQVSRYNVSDWQRGTTEGKELKVLGSTGFNALLSGRGAPYAFDLMGSFEYYYTSTDYNTNYAWRRCLRSNYNTIGRWNTFLKTYAFSVRCVKD